MKTFLLLLFFVLFIASTGTVTAQNYQLVWEDNFNGATLDSSKWNIEQKIGVWNTGSNNEFQHYRKENVTVGNDGDGNNCLIITAKKENYNGYHYTSSRINTKGKMAFRNGKVEAMIKIPNLANGLWPAFWSLGYTPKGWPDCGEIDILEMGHAAGITAGKQNSFIGSHLFWGPYPRDHGTTYIASQDLSKGYFKHTLVWTENSISTYFNDSPTPYFSMKIDGSDVEEFRNFQDYLIFNLAVGGSVPGIKNESAITASFPAKMYVDWVKVYQETGKTNLAKSELPLYGIFGVYEDEAGADMRMTIGYDLSVHTTELSAKTGETPKAGNNTLAFNTTANKDFELKLKAGLPRNFSNYQKGSIQFYIKSDITSDLQIGVSDTKGNQAFVSLPAKNFSPATEWHLASITFAEIAGKIDISTLSDLLIIKGNSASNGKIDVDEVIVSETMPAEGYYGIFTNNSNITNKFPLDDVTGHLYNWENTVAFNTTYPAYDGKDVLSFRSAGSAGWWGFGIFSDNAINLENYAKGYLNLMMRTESKETFKIAINGANKTSGDVEFKSGSDPYSFVRDGKWHRVVVPMPDLTTKGLDLSACGNIFTISGGNTTTIGIDDIFLSENISTIVNPDTCYAVSITITPENPTMKVGTKKKFTAKATNQFGNPADAFVTWESTGGTVLQDGYFSATEAGTYTITARMGKISKSTTAIVQNKTGIKYIDNQVVLGYSTDTKLLTLDGLNAGNQVEMYSATGALIFSKKADSAGMEIDMGNFPTSTYFIKVKTEKNVEVNKFINK